MTNTGPRLLKTGKLDSGGGKKPGLIVPIAVLAATANPIGLIVMGTAKVEGEMTGRTKIEGTAKRTAEVIGEQLRIRFKEEGLIKWILVLIQVEPQYWRRKPSQRPILRSA